MKLGIAACMLLFPFWLFSQVNTERYRKDYETLGFTLTNTTGFNYETGNTEELEISESVRLDWNNPIQDYYAVLEYDFKTASNVKTKDKGFIHLRTIRDLKGNYFFGEAFTQYEMDRFLNLQSRFLFGGGLRVDFISMLKENDTTQNNVKLFAGVGLMYENEVYSSEETIYISHLRSTNYISLIMAITADVDLGVVYYYQPAIKDFKDYRHTTDIKFRMKISDRLSLLFTVRHKHRSLIVDDTDKNDLQLQSAIVLRLP